MWFGQGVTSGFKIYAANFKSFFFVAGIFYMIFCAAAYYLYYVFKKLGGPVTPPQIFDIFCDNVLYFYFLVSPFVVRVTISYSLGHAPNSMLAPLRIREAVYMWLTALIFTIMAVFAISSYSIGIFIMPLTGPFGFVVYTIATLVVLIFLLQTPLALVVCAHEKRYFWAAFKRGLDLVSERKFYIVTICLFLFLVFNSLTALVFMGVENMAFSHFTDLTDNQKVFMSNRLYHTTELALGALFAPLVSVYLTLFYFQIVKERDEFFY